MCYRFFVPYKSPEMNGIFPALLQEGREVVISCLIRIYRACVSTGYRPAIRRQVKVVFFVNKTSLMQFFRYLLYPIQLYMFRMLRPSILRSTVMYRQEATVYVRMWRVVRCRVPTSPHPPKKVKVLFMFKPGRYSYNGPRDFRPISLTSFLLKTIERLVDT